MIDFRFGVDGVSVVVVVLVVGVETICVDGNVGTTGPLILVEDVGLIGA